MATIADAVVQLHAAALPVLFADTCSLIDVIRAPTRPNDLSGCVRAAAELRQSLTVAPIRSKLIVASFVPTEWQAHAESEKEKLCKHFALMDEFARVFHDSCNRLGIPPPFGQSAYGDVALAEHLFDLSRQLLDAAIRVVAQDDTNLRAFARATEQRPPSKKGSEIKDCTILKECLEVARQLRTTGFGQRMVFCTSNTNDYCDGKILHPSIASDFADVGLFFSTNLPWAIYELRK